MPFENATCNLNFRKYQQDMLAVFETCHSNKDHKFHLVAPPGSGKTIIGLEMMRRLGQPAVVFSPNQAIQSGWLSQLKSFSFDLTGSADPGSGADLLSLTYQSISVKEKGQDKLHPNALTLLAEVARRGTLILDECHHLTDFWARILLENILPSQYLIALTATPPRDRSAGEWQNYITLLGEIDYEIILPPIIKEGFLAPYQDLIYTVSPSASEVELINQLCQPYRVVMEKLLNCTEVMPVHFWAENLLDDYRDADGKAVPFDEALKQEFELLVALVRFVQRYLGDLPPAVFLVEEMEDPLNFEDVLLVLREYVIRYLGKKSAGEPLYRELKQALKSIGYKLTRRSLGVLPGGIKGIISLSESKLAALVPLIGRELINMQDELRLLILTDCETSGEREGTSAVDVMRFITSHSETDPVDPVLVTGSSVLVDDDLAEVFLDYAERYLREHNLVCSLSKREREGFCEILGSGRDWTTRTYVAFISRMLEEGVTRCLVSTRNLLGEGWNSERLNTLIDLTVVSSYAFVNQIRGRTIRLNPDKPLKTANNWDVVALLDNPIEGSYDLKRVGRKYSCFYGLSEDNVIEAGIGHVHPLFTTGDAPLILNHLAELNRDMLTRCGERLAVYKRWKIGQEFTDTFTECLEVLPLAQSGLPALPRTELMLRKNLRQLIRWSRVSRILANGTWITLLVMLYSTSIKLLPVLFTTMILAVFFSREEGTTPWSYLARQLTCAGIRKPVPLYAKLALFCRVVLRGLQLLNLCEKHLSEKQIQILRRKDGRYRIYLAGSKGADFFSRALRELLAPVQEQRYFVYEKIISKEFVQAVWNKKLHGLLYKKYPLQDKVSCPLAVYPVPGVFGKNATSRRIFLKLWQELVCPGKMLSAPEIDREYLRKRPLPLIVKHKRIWF